MAGRHGLVRVLDIDYRPVLWGLASRGDGETRYVASAEVSRRLQAELGQFELIIGTEEEWLIAGGVEGDLIASLRRVRECSRAVFVVKRGPLGCSLIEGAVPDAIDQAPNREELSGQTLISAEIARELGITDRGAERPSYRAMLGNPRDKNPAAVY